MSDHSEQGDEIDLMLDLDWDGDDERPAFAAPTAIAPAPTPPAPPTTARADIAPRDAAMQPPTPPPPPSAPAAVPPAPTPTVREVPDPPSPAPGPRVAREAPLDDTLRLDMEFDATLEMDFDTGFEAPVETRVNERPDAPSAPVEDAESTTRTPMPPREIGLDDTALDTRLDTKLDTKLEMRVAPAMRDDTSQPTIAESLLARTVLDAPRGGSAKSPKSPRTKAAASGVPEPRFSGSSLDFGRLSLDDEQDRREAQAIKLPPLVETTTMIVSIAAVVFVLVAAVVFAFGDRLLDLF